MCKKFRVKDINFNYKYIHILVQKCPSRYYQYVETYSLISLKSFLSSLQLTTPGQKVLSNFQIKIPYLTQTIYSKYTVQATLIILMVQIKKEIQNRIYLLQLQIIILQLWMLIIFNRNILSLWNLILCYVIKLINNRINQWFIKKFSRC